MPYLFFFLQRFDIKIAGQSYQIKLVLSTSIFLTSENNCTQTWLYNHQTVIINTYILWNDQFIKQFITINRKLRNNYASTLVSISSFCLRSVNLNKALFNVYIKHYTVFQLLICQSIRFWRRIINKWFH